MRFFLLLVFTFTFLCGKAQEYPVIEQNGKKYYQYLVQPGNTLYGISKSFLVPVNDIVSANPELIDGLRAGQIIRIPVSKENKNLQKADAPVIKNDKLFHTVQKGETLYAIAKNYQVGQEEIVALNSEELNNGLRAGMVLTIPMKGTAAAVDSSRFKTNNWIKHRVQKGDTYYSLAKRYNVNIDSIPLVNNGLPQGLKEGEEINIPVAAAGIQVTGKDTIYSFIKRSLAPGEVRKVALLLPFFIRKNLETESGERPGRPEIYEPSRVAVTFYQGFMLGMDSLYKGDSAEVYVFDTSNDSAEISNLLSNPLMKEMDLIIGPLYATYFNRVAAFAAANSIPLISPFSQTAGIGDNNPWVIKLTPSTRRLMEETGKIIEKLYPSGSNFILVNTNSAADKKLVSAFRDAVGSRIPLKEASLLPGGVKGIQAMLNPAGPNVIIVPSAERAVVTDLLTKLYFTDKYDISVVGTDVWMNFENLDIEYLEKLRITLPVPGFVNYGDTAIMNLIQHYRARFGSDADEYSIRAFDISVIAGHLMNNRECLSNPVLLEGEGNYSRYRFTRHDPSDGIENTGLRLIRFGNYRFNIVTSP